MTLCPPLTEPKSDVVHVVTGLLVQEGRILLTQRCRDKDFPFLWETPGGKVETGEAHNEALKRELAEELKLDLTHTHDTALWSGRFTAPVQRVDRQAIQLYLYVVGDWNGFPVPQETQGCGWFRPRDVLFDTLAPGNQRAWERIVRYVRELGGR